MFSRHRRPPDTLSLKLEQSHLNERKGGRSILFDGGFSKPLSNRLYVSRIPFPKTKNETGQQSQSEAISFKWVAEDSTSEMDKRDSLADSNFSHTRSDLGASD